MTKHQDSRSADASPSGPPPTQRTKPKKGEPVEIPVPKRVDVQRDLLKVALKRERGQK